MNVRPASFFDYKPRERVPFKQHRDPMAELRAENPLSSQAFEVAHMGTDITLDYAHDGLAGMAAGGAALGIAAVSACWGVARLRSSALPDKIDGIGHLALAGSSGMHALEHLGGVHLAGGPALEVVHGLATVGLGVSELIRARQEGPLARQVVGASEIAIGLAIAGSGVFGHLAPGLHLAAAAALVVKEIALNRR